MGRSSEKAGEGGEGRAGRRAAQGLGTGERGVAGSPPAAAIQATGYPARSTQGDAGEGLEEDQG